MDPAHLHKRVLGQSSYPPGTRRAFTDNFDAFLSWTSPSASGTVSLLRTTRFAWSSSSASPCFFGSETPVRSITLQSLMLHLPSLTLLLSVSPLPVVNADYSIALSTLLRYPTLNPPLSIPLLLTQALALRDSSASPATGVAIVMQNEEVLGIPAKPPPADEQEYDTPRRGGGGRRPPPLQALPVGAGRIAQVQMGIAGLGLGDVAKGLLERGQALGIDKAILSRVTEIRVSPFAKHPFCSLFLVV